jgi:type 1 glutamine amidotransferase
MFRLPPSRCPLLAVLLMPAALCSLAIIEEGAARAGQDAEVASRFAVLVFSRTVGYRHEAIPSGIAAIQRLGTQHDFAVDATEDPTRFTDEGLARYRVVVFLNTTGNVLDAAQQAAFQRFIRRGGGFVGVHSATDTEYEWPWYGNLVGAYFRNHPAIQSATLSVVDSSHVSTRHLPAQWRRTDEWYNFRMPPPADVTVLMRIDESSYSGGNMGEQHPMAWCHSFEGGRAWYTALGHTLETYSDPLFLDHLRGGIEWAAAMAPQ